MIFRKTVYIFVFAISSLLIPVLAADFPQKTVNGKGFYIYQIGSGEGFYSICKKFDVTKDEILLYNPSVKDGLKKGQEILIPIKTDIEEKSPCLSKSFVHTISRGESLYSIAKMYHVKKDDIVALNPGAEKGIRAGDKLNIPQSIHKAAEKTVEPEKKEPKVQKTDTEIPESENTKYIFHTITAKETLFSVSRDFDTSVESILKENPGLSPSNFSIGKVIRIIPGEKIKDKGNLEQPVIVEEPQINTQPYTVKKKETLYSISQKFNIMVPDIIQCNPGIGQISKGDVIKIPIKTISQETPAQPEAKENINQIYEQLHSGVKKDQVNIAVLLPFMLNQPESTKNALYLEYYQGFLIAVDSLKKQGANIDVYAFDTEGADSKINTILSRSEMKTMDLIIGPADNDLIKKTADFALENEINLVNAFSLKNDEYTHNSRIFQTNIPHSYLFAETSEALINQFGKKKIVFLLENNAADDKTEFVETVKADLRKNGISSMDIQINSDAELAALSSRFSDSSDILFISNTSNRSSVGKIVATLSKLKDDRNDISITLFGYPEWQTYTKDYLDGFYKLNTVIFTRFYTSPTDYDGKEFQRKFRFWYNKDMINANPRYGLLGFDTGMYFLKALQQNGKKFENKLHRLQSSSIQTDFNFQRVNNWGGFINKSIYFVHFTPSYSIRKEAIN